ncbi:MAG: hypothetical protein KDD15_01475, partial [Lewinella sp.]|nr:hypothetical protein [Lewinella sp.]
MFRSKSIQLVFSIVLAAGVWLLLTVMAGLFTDGTGIHRFLEALGGSGAGYIQAMIYGVFFYSIFELLEKRRYIQQQYQGFNLGLLPIKDQLVLSPEEV